MDGDGDKFLSPDIRECSSMLTAPAPIPGFEAGGGSAVDLTWGLSDHESGARRGGPILVIREAPCQVNHQAPTGLKAGMGAGAVSIELHSRTVGGTGTYPHPHPQGVFQPRPAGTC